MIHHYRMIKRTCTTHAKVMQFTLLATAFWMKSWFFFRSNGNTWEPNERIGLALNENTALALNWNIALALNEIQLTSNEEYKSRRYYYFGQIEKSEISINCKYFNIWSLHAYLTMSRAESVNRRRAVRFICFSCGVQFHMSYRADNANDISNFQYNSIITLNHFLLILFYVLSAITSRFIYSEERQTLTREKPYFIFAANPFLLESYQTDNNRRMQNEIAVSGAQPHTQLNCDFW